MEQVISMSTGVQVTPLDRILHPDGDVYRGMKVTESTFNGFGEAYFTTIHHGHIKGWKKHKRMVINLVVPVGVVTFFMHDEVTARTNFITLGDSNYARLTVPCGIWLAFVGVGSGLNLVLNIASIPHDPDESLTLPIEKFPISGDLCENITIGR